MSEFPDELAPIAARLERERPVPRAAFRGDLRRSLVRPQQDASPRPAWLWPRVAALGALGLVLLVIAGAGLSGAGPLAPDSAGKTADLAQR